MLLTRYSHLGLGADGNPKESAEKRKVNIAPCARSSCKNYAPTRLDRDVVAPDQIRTVIQTFRDRLSTDLFPGRTEAAKTLIFAKHDSHADDIVQLVR